MRSIGDQLGCSLIDDVRLRYFRDGACRCTFPAASRFLFCLLNSFANAANNVDVDERATEGFEVSNDPLSA